MSHTGKENCGGGANVDEAAAASGPSAASRTRAALQSRLEEKKRKIQQLRRAREELGSGRFEVGPTSPCNPRVGSHASPAARGPTSTSSSTASAAGNIFAATIGGAAAAAGTLAGTATSSPQPIPIPPRATARPLSEDLSGIASSFASPSRPHSFGASFGASSFTSPPPSSGPPQTPRSTAMDQETLAAHRLARLVTLTHQRDTLKRSLDNERAKSARLEKNTTQLKQERATLKQELVAEQQAHRAAAERLAELEKRLVAKSRPSVSPPDTPVPSPTRGSRSGSPSEQTIANLEQALASAREEAESHKSRLALALEDLDQAQEQMESVRRVLPMLFSADGIQLLQGANIDLSQFQEEFQLQEMQNEEYQALLADSMEQVEELRNQLRMATESHDMLFQTTQELEEENRKLKDEKELLSRAQGAGNRQFDKLEEDHLELMKARHQLDKALETEQEKYALASKELSELRDELGELSGALEECRRERDAEQSRADSLAAKLANVEAERVFAEETLAGVYVEFQERELVLRQEVETLSSAAAAFATELQQLQETSEVQIAVAREELAKQRSSAAEQEGQKYPALFDELNRHADKLRNFVNNPEEGPYAAQAKAAAAKSKDMSASRAESIISAHRSSSPRPTPASEEDELREHTDRNRAIYRRNLVWSCQRSVRRLLETADGSAVDETNDEFDAFCIIMEEILNHGLHVKRAWFELKSSTKPAFWNFVRRALPAGRSNVKAVERFEDSKTAWGKGRAWLRISLMEKRLAEYFAYVNHRENMKRSWYEPWALMRSEEASVIESLLVSLNALNFTACLKGSALDVGEANVIDFVRYHNEEKARLDMLYDDLEYERAIAGLPSSPGGVGPILN